MDTDQIAKNWVARLEKLLTELEASVEDINIMRDGIKDTLGKVKARTEMTRYPRRLLNGSDSPDEFDYPGAAKIGLTNYESVRNYLSGFPAKHFTSLTAWSGYSKAYPGLLSKIQFLRTFGKIAYRDQTHLKLVEKRPGNIPNVYTWINDPNSVVLSEREQSQ
jgi:hypothetical protein